MTRPVPLQRPLLQDTRDAIAVLRLHAHWLLDTGEANALHAAADILHRLSAHTPNAQPKEERVQT